METNNSSYTFALIHGARHGAWCWEQVAPALQLLGHRVIAPDLDISNPLIKMHDHAAQVTRELAGYDNIVLVAHSRGADVATRVAEVLPSVRKRIYVAGGIRPAQNQISLLQNAPAKSSQQYLSNIITREDGLTIFNPQEVRQYFYHDCLPAVADTSAAKLRPQNINDASPPLPTQPEVPSAYIICEQDRVINPDWQHFAANTLLNGADIRTIASSHSPFLSMPSELTQLLLDLA